MNTQLGASVRLLVLLTALLGLAYPLAMTGFAQVAFPGNADGSLVTRNGTVVGSDLIGQDYTVQQVENGEPVVDADGNPVIVPDPSYFQSRPSAAGAGYDPLATSASNLGPESPDLVAAIEDRRAAAAALDGVDPQDVATHALLASGSGLDPHISPEYAEQQVPRIAATRGISEAQVREIVAANTKGRTLGFLGEPRVNVLQLNLALDTLTDAAD